VLTRQTDGEGSWVSGDIFCVPFVSAHEVELKMPKKNKEGKVSEIHIPAQCELRMVGHKDYIEYTGNEAQPGEHFGGGIFVAVKSSN
jgi:hypothetical protein